MSRTITAMFDSRSEAESAREQLRTATGADARIIDKSSAGSEGPGESRGFWADLKDAFMPDEDRTSYEEGVRRGGFLLCATVDESKADKACGILQSSGSVDFDSREQQWREEGWTGHLVRNENIEQRGRTGERDDAVEEERIPIVDEQLRVGKREVNRGGAHVRSYVQETPVSEQVNLREENVSVERRPVDERLSSKDLSESDLLRERSIDMRATGEEAVIGKDARVKEELVVKKTADNRTENVQDTVRHTEVDIDKRPETSSSRALEDDRSDHR